MSKLIITSAEELSILIQKSVQAAFKNRRKPTLSASKTRFLTLEAASGFLNLAKQIIYGFTSKNVIPFIKRGKKIMFEQESLEKWLLEGKRKSISELENELKSNSSNG